MITLRSGDLLASDAEALVNTVNTVGVMGKGLALQFKKAFPENYAAYRSACQSGKLRIGSMFITSVSTLAGVRFIVNFPTKRHWKDSSRMEDIEAGLAALAGEIRNRNIRSIAIPPLGCGLGGLQWSEVKKRIENTFMDFADVDILLYAPQGVKAGCSDDGTSKSPWTDWSATDGCDGGVFAQPLASVASERLAP